MSPGDDGSRESGREKKKTILDCFRLPKSSKKEKQTPSGNQVSPLKKKKKKKKKEKRTSQRTTESPEPSPSPPSYRKSSSFEGKIQQMKSAMRRKPPKKVGIFSRAAESEYQWLKTKLESASCVKSVRSCYISNSGFREFSENVSSCDFGILYHTMNRGRVNLTDVRDSLYDEELEKMSERLGKKNVIVVIDDLKDSGEERKEEILKGQPKLGTLAANVFLFSVEEKKEKTY